MKIKFNQKYKSINNFSEIDIEDFSVFLGMNGAGKTHLLKAIQNGSISIESVPIKNILYFNLQTFSINNQKAVTQRNIDDEKTQAWGILISRRQMFQNNDNQLKTLIEGGELTNPYDAKSVTEGKVAQFEQIKTNILGLIDTFSANNSKMKKLLKTGIFESGKYASEITQEDFFRSANYNPDDYELLENLSEIFFNYHKELESAKLPKEFGGKGLDIGKIKELQERSPWSFINTVFEEFGLPHNVTYPKFTIGEMADSRALSFQAKLSIDGEEIDFEDLSSGEKILCSLAVTIYQDSKTSFPELLLLDEVDASLHPSMIQNLLDVINTVFIKNNCKVILATHSPTTVALAPESSLFEVKKGKIVEKIKKVSKSNAIDLLSEGVMTLEKGLKIFDAIFKKDLTVMSEGTNIEHIKKAITVLDEKLLDNIQLYEHKHNSGASDLSGIFEFIKIANIEKKVIFIWDCDQQVGVNKKEETDRVFKFCFEANASNKICKKGVENLYPERMFMDGFFKKITIEENNNTPIEKFEFVENKKNDFLMKIKEENDPDVFKNFIPLVNKIKGILNVS